MTVFCLFFPTTTTVSLLYFNMPLTIQTLWGDVIQTCIDNDKKVRGRGGIYI